MTGENETLLGNVGKVEKPAGSLRQVQVLKYGKILKMGKKKPIKLSVPGCFHMTIAASLPSVNAGAGSSMYVRWEPSGSSPCVDLSLHLSLASSLFLLPLSVSSYKQFYQ